MLTLIGLQLFIRTLPADEVREQEQQTESDNRCDEVAEHDEEVVHRIVLVWCTDHP